MPHVEIQIFETDFQVQIFKPKMEEVIFDSKIFPKKFNFLGLMLGGGVLDARGVRLG